ncbi:MAG TPA: nuclear transport factor 2 family protein [Solirubrobacteraceae bacterium]|nr:nuclear transport factor 2 family protein [Solirubrobacteraceae bacterium]
MSQQNVDLVRSLLAEWDRGDFRSREWAAPGVEFVLADGPEPGRWHGVAGLAAYWRDFLRHWQGFHVSADSVRELDDGRVLAFLRLSGRATASGVAVQQPATAVFRLDDGKVTELLYFNDREGGLNDLGLAG